MVLKVFISSTYTDSKELRQRLAKHIEAEGHLAILAEPTADMPGGVDINCFTAPDVVEISDQCLKALSSSDAVVCVLAGALGSPIRLGEMLCRARHFELEVFSAFLQRKPILLCSLPDFSPDAETDAFLRCIKSEVPTEDRIQVKSASDLFDAVASFCEKLAPKDSREDSKRKVSYHQNQTFPQALSIVRASYASVRSHKMLLPFLGDLTGGVGRPNVDVARVSLDSAIGQKDMHIKIGRLWIALRELLPSKPQDVADRAVLEIWDDLLSEWVRAGSWYGLHAHLYLGAVAAATGLWHIRSTYNSKLRVADTKREMPVGAIASTNYSLIQRLPNPIVRHLAFRSLRRFLDHNMKMSSKIAGNLQIRGSINTRLLNLFAAVRDFRTALEIYERDHAPPETIGDAMVHLAVPLFVLQRRGEARRLFDIGLDMMRGRAQTGFFLRALKKATYVEEQFFGDLERSQHFRAEAKRFGQADGYLDQSRHFDG